MTAGIGRGAALAMAMAGTAMPATAMVPPVFQRLVELRNVIEVPNLAASLGVPIDRIELVAPRLYRVTAGRCHVDVRMVEVPGGPGAGLTPPRLEARAGPRVCGP